MKAGWWDTCLGYLLSGGWLMLPTALAIFGIWFLYLREYLRILRDLRHSLPSDARELESPVGAAPRLARAAKAISQDAAQFSAHFESLAQAEYGRFSGNLLLLGALVTAAPLMGLLGTVLGMIDTFTAVAGGSGDIASMVADGIRLALVTTQTGLVAALPGTFALAHLAWKRHVLRSRLPHCAAFFAGVLYRREA